jgi:hypothetical protein
MAQTGYSVLSLYYSSTAAAAPTAGNLVAGELAINTNDGVLYYKDSSGVVQSIASKAGNSGSFTNLAYTGTLTGGTGVVNLGSGQFYKDASGNVGIGTTTMTGKLNVAGNVLPSADSSYSLGASGSRWLTVNAATFSEGGATNNFITTSSTTTLFNSGSTWQAAAIYTNGSESMRVNSTGNIVLKGGTTSANGVGITFPATQSASSDANCLDDYEEGTFTPTVFGTTTAGTATYSQNSGTYVKIGKLVQFSLYVEWTAGTGTGSMRVGNLPFTVSNENTFPAVTIGYCTLLSLSALNIATAYCSNNTTQIVFEQYPTGGGSSSNVPYDNAAGFVLSGTYRVA